MKKPLDMEEMVQTTPVEQYLTVITMRWITVAPYWTINPRGIYWCIIIENDGKNGSVGRSSS